MANAKTANEIASLFFERFRDQEPLIEDFGPQMGKHQTWTSGWLTKKQVDWLRNVWQRENRRTPFGRHGTVNGSIPNAYHCYWSLYVSPTGSGTLKVSQNLTWCEETGDPPIISK